MKWEFRDAARWKRLRCRRVIPLKAEGDAERAIYALDVGHTVAFDWTWEGAAALRPTDVKEFAGQIEVTGDQPDSVAGRVWSGEIVQVDETNGRIFVCVSEADGRPTTGTFFVRSFDTLRHLHAVFCDSKFEDVRQLLPSRLSACRGRVRAEIESEVSGGLSELSEVWRYAWGMIWAPPGTGKTDLIGRQVAACSDDPTERFLVVSTTNKATDAAAISIGLHWQSTSSNAIENGQLRRLGISPFARNFAARNLGGILCTSNQKAHFVSQDARVIVATTHNVLELINDPEIHSMIAAGHAPFTTVVVDEAGQLPRAVVAVLSLLASRRVVLAGDSKQLEPVSRTSRVESTNQATWLSSSALHDLRSFKQLAPQLHVLYQQHRMHPDVRKIVSANQYEDKLTDAPSVLSRQFAVPPLLADQPRTIWYVLDADGDDVPSIRAERGPAGRSWLRAKTRDVLNRILADPQLKQMRGHFVTPFVAQAHDIARLFAEHGLTNWTSDTVYGRTVSESDLVIFDTVNAGSCGWTEDQWQRVVNVGMSKAREFMILLASRAEMEQPFLKRLLPHLAPRVLVQSGDSLAWRQVPQAVDYEPTDEETESPELMGGQLSNRRRLRPVMSAEQQKLCGLTLDGRPRLVRGVAGSGKTIVMAHWIVKTVMKMADQPDARIWAVYANTALKGLICEAIDEAWKVDHNGTPFPWERVSIFHVREVLELMLPEVGVKMYSSDYEFDRASNAYLQRRSPEEITPRCDAMFIDEAQDMGPHTIKLLNLLVTQTDEDDPNSRCVNVFYDDGQNVHDRDVPKWSEMGLDVRGRSTVSTLR